MLFLKRTFEKLMIFFLGLRRIVCLTSPSTSSSPPLRIVSLNRNGGNVKYFDLVDDTDYNVDCSSGGKNVDDKTMFDSIIKDPIFVVRTLKRHVFTAMRSTLAKTFLPTGFPGKTPPNYLRFSFWSWIQDVSTQLRSVLATQRILEGVGVGSSEATALSALFNYLVRDGCGMAAGLLFTYAASSRFRTDSKRWRIFADVSVDIGITLEVVATLFPKPLFLPCICVGNMFKAVCGVAAGACGGSINLHWATGSDISDINAKFGAQHTVTGAIGLIFAGIFAKSVTLISPLKLWMLYFSLTYLHLYANVRCMRLISFDYLNTIRIDMILRQYMTREDKSISTPQEIAAEESLWFQIPILGRIFTRNISSEKPSIHFGVAFDEFCKRSGKPVGMLLSDLDLTQTNLQSDKKSITQHTTTVSDAYLISSGVHGREVVVSFLMNVSSEQQTKAYFHAWLLGSKLQENEKYVNGISTIDLTSRLEVEEETKLLLESAWVEFRQNCIDVGWYLSRSELQTRGFEVKIE